MDGARGSFVIALLLVIAGFLGFITQVPLFALIGAGLLLLAPIAVIAEAVSQYRIGRSG